MKNLRIALAQISLISGDVDANIKSHLKVIKRASSLKITYLVFPELSLTGYEPRLASQLAFSDTDSRLQPLIDAAIKYQITIAVGAPLLNSSAHSSLPSIGLIMINVQGEIQTYQKMHLHQSEEAYFSAGSQPHIITFHDTKIANAICADSNDATHCRTYAELGASVYIAGSMITAGGYKADTDKLQAHARDHNMLVALANYDASTTPFSDGWAPIGKSAFWTNKGLLVCANEFQEALVIAKKVNEEWIGEVVPLAEVP
tara:strand:- start:2648 stop:3424 length:777 start_codon:yes stop_codon:yes gene_type:complete